MKLNPAHPRACISIIACIKTVKNGEHTVSKGDTAQYGSVLTIEKTESPKKTVSISKIDTALGIFNRVLSRQDLSRLSHFH